MAERGPPKGRFACADYEKKKRAKTDVHLQEGSDVSEEELCGLAIRALFFHCFFFFF